jgi:hypothetical protein
LDILDGTHQGFERRFVGVEYLMTQVRAQRAAKP